MKTLFYFLAFVLVLVACTNLEDAKPTKRATFIRFYEAPYNMRATSLEVTGNGFIILGNLDVANIGIETATALVEANAEGDQVGTLYTYEGGTGKNVKSVKFANGQSGYVIIGDSTNLDPFAEQAANVAISSLRMLVLNSSFQLVNKFVLSDNSANPAAVKADFFGGSINVTPDGRLILLGTFKEGVINQQTAPAKQLLAVLNPDFTVNWTNTFDLLDNTYQNSKSVHFSPTGSIIWATAIADIQGNFNSSWLAIPAVRDSAVYDNFSQLGQTSQQLMVPSDIQPGESPGYGFGVVGTYSQATDGSKGNMFFVRVFPNGSIDAASARYFDGIQSVIPTATGNLDKNTSDVVDQGLAITSTTDGGFLLAGSSDNSQLGNGKDIFLVKIDGFGNIQWTKILGGSGDEEVAVVRELDDRSLLICGTHTIGQRSSIFLMKTDRNGELTK
ncbi:MAG: hypothetical protein JNL17_05515 [Cyclobacteriaceae bacterium]|nr:hypothetical protein [Cyclobacteriaceae bacterium]